MITPTLFWYLCFLCFLLGFVYILWKERDWRFFFYFVFGSLVAFFVFDTFSTVLGYYQYSTQHFLFSIGGVPISMTIAEGFCIAITIYLFERLPRFFGLFKRK
jgi:hypothetical protein